ncbi:putative F-box domain, leucine-rich repeat domain superfamily, F-box-like domain superfamily [Dioscorea sansibarensis]
MARRKLAGDDDHIDILPDECLLQVFSFLPSPRDRCSCAAVSKKWLFLQLHMQFSDFQHDPNQVECSEVSRSLEGELANDVRLAAMVVGVYPHSLTELTILQGFFSSSSSSSSLGHNEVVTDLGLKIIGFTCSTLKCITLSNCAYASDAGLACIARGCKNLEKLNIYSSSRITNDGLTIVAKSCLKLSMVDFKSCTSIGNQSLEAIAEYSSQLESISLTKCPHIGDHGIVSIVSKLLKLTRISLVSMEITDKVFKAIGEQGRSLEVLSLDSIKGTTEIGYSFISGAQKLKVLTVSSCSSLTDTSFISSSSNGGFPSLKRAEIRSNTSLTDKGLIKLTQGSHMLENLKLEKCHKITTLGLMQALSNCSNTLKKLSLVQCDQIGQPPVAPSPEKQHRAQPVLFSMKLKKCKSIGEPFLAWIGESCKEAKKIAMVGMSNGITDTAMYAFLKAMGRAGSVKSLDLSGSGRIRDWSVAAITAAFGRTLERLCLVGCKGVSEEALGMIGERCEKLEDLDLSLCDVGDEALRRMASSRALRLKTLALAGCERVTDDGLAALELMGTSFNGLNLIRCSGISARRIESIRETLWWCDLVF